MKTARVWKFGTSKTVRSLTKPFVNGKKHGMGIQYREDGSKRVKPLEDGVREGMEITYYEDGSKFSETPYVDGNANGTGIRYREDGSKEIETIFVKINTNLRFGTEKMDRSGRKYATT